MMGKMEKIIGMLSSPSTSLLASPPKKLDDDFTSNPQRAMTTHRSLLESLPAEVITQILDFLPPVSLADLLRTSRLLRSHAQNDLLWMRFVRENVPRSTQLPSYLPASSWKDLYASHHPYWFLTRRKIWFSDAPHTGGLVIARYDHRRGCIEAYRLLAKHGLHTFQMWDYNPAVLIHTFDPKVNLMFDDPVVRLSFEHNDRKRLQREVAMQTGQTPGICSLISLCQPIPRLLQDPSMALWPPATVPSVQRVRNASANKFRTDSHRPKTLADASDRTFRIRRFMQWSNLMQPIGSVRMGEEVLTFSTLLEETYMPTNSKPWQGIWVGDYSAHGCEFLLLVQRENTICSSTPSRRSSTSSGLPSGIAITSHHMERNNIEEDTNEGVALTLSTDHTQSSRDGDMMDEGLNLERPPSGSLEAIKLTGDINIPRGECTWFAKDIGNEGLIRVADEYLFKGARIVKSMGHVAAQGFKNDRFIDSQLIMISHDTLAQYWEVSQARSLLFGSSKTADRMHRNSVISPSTSESTSRNIWLSEQSNWPSAQA